VTQSANRRIDGVLLGIVALAALTIVGTASELAMDHHWETTVQLIPWLCLVVASAALVGLVARPSRPTIIAVRVVMGLLVVAGLIGVAEHTISNHDAGSFDAVYGERWAQLSGPSRWWHAVIHDVGASPTLAPLVLAEIAGLVLLASLRTDRRGRSAPARPTRSDDAAPALR